MNHALDDLSRLRADARTAWAIYEFESYEKHPRLMARDANVILNELDEDEHVELFVMGKVSTESFLLGSNRANKQKFSELLETFSPDLAVKTRHRLFMLSNMDNRIILDVAHFRQGPRSTNIAEYCIDHGERIWFFIPDPRVGTILYKGAGNYILKLPLQPGVPELSSEWMKISENTHVMPKADGSLLAGWQSAEEIAYLHIRDLGFGNVRRAGPGSDGGIDVRGSGIVAQVKMTALPVGRPVLQQLVGAAPTTSHRACYSTSGYTRDAFVYARQQELALFQIETTGSVKPRNDVAVRLVRTASNSQESLSWRSAYAFAEGALARMKVWFDDPKPNPNSQGSNAERSRRARSIAVRSHSSYLAGARSAITKLPSFNTAREMVIHYHHAELLLAVAVSAQGFRYDDAPSRATARAHLSTKDFY